MYYNANGERISRARWKELYRAFKNRQELIKAGLTRRDLAKMGLLTGAGLLVAKNGLSSRAYASWGSGSNCRYDNSGCGNCASPFTTPWIMNMPIPPVKQSIPLASLTGPAPTIAPNNAINPTTGIAYEGRTRAHQSPIGTNSVLPFPATKVYQVTQQPAEVQVAGDLPPQTLWTFDGVSPGPTYVAQYGTPILIRNYNNLPTDNGGFGLNSVTTHLHNGHTPSESDGFPCDYFAAGQYYDQYYPNQLAGFLSTHQSSNGDINEALSSLWYHDHREGFTSQNIYKGLVGNYLLFNAFDTGNRPPASAASFPDYDIPMIFADRCFDASTGALAFDTFNIDGILGDKFMVNGVIQPVLHVHPRRYRFRWTNTGPSRFLQLYLTDLANPSTSQPFWQISNDGNLLPHPVQVPAVALGVAERADVIIDFAQYAGRTIYIENRLLQPNGQGGPTGSVVAGGQGFLTLQIVVDLPAIADDSAVPSPSTSYYALPSVSGTPRVTRNFKFDQDRNGQWIINDKLFSCNAPRFLVQQNTLEQWNFENGRNWSHPIHVHLEEHQVTKGAPGL